MGVVINGIVTSPESAFLSFEDFVRSLNLDQCGERETAAPRSDATADPTRAAVDPVVQ